MFGLERRLGTGRARPQQGRDVAAVDLPRRPRLGDRGYFWTSRAWRSRRRASAIGRCYRAAIDAAPVLAPSAPPHLAPVPLLQERASSASKRAPILLGPHHRSGQLLVAQRLGIDDSCNESTVATDTPSSLRNT